MIDERAARLSCRARSQPLFRSACRASKNSAIGKMSSGRSRSAMILNSITFNRKNRSSRNAPWGDRARQIGVGGADQAHVALARDVAAQALELAGLQHAQELHLAHQRQVADLVQKQRAAVGFLEAPDAQLLGAGIGAGLGAEQLGFEQLVGQTARRSPCTNGLIFAARVGLDDLREPLLTRAVGSGDEHRAPRTAPPWRPSVTTSCMAGAGVDQAAQVVPVARPAREHA